MAEHLSGRGDADARVAEIAYHRLESLPAGDPAAAVAWAQRAADRAMAQYAWEEAARSTGGRWTPAIAHDLADPARQCRLLLAIAGGPGALVRRRRGPRRAARGGPASPGRLGDFEAIARAALTMEGVSDHLWNVDRTGTRRGGAGRTPH